MPKRKKRRREPEPPWELIRDELCAHHQALRAALVASRVAIERKVDACTQASRAWQEKFLADFEAITGHRLEPNLAEFEATTGHRLASESEQN